MALGDVFGLDRVYENQLQNYTNYSSETISSYGYSAGGFSPSPDTNFSTIYRIDFNTDTWTRPGTNLIQGLHSLQNIGNNRSQYGYYTQGSTDTPGSGFVSDYIRIDFINESVSAIPANNPITGVFAASVESSDYGYTAGGRVGSPEILSSDISRFEFDTETAADITANLSDEKRTFAGFYGATAGYFANGSTPTNISTIDKLTFSSETLAVSPQTTSFSERNPAGTQSSSYGFIVGGNSNSNIDRLDFITDTTIDTGNNAATGTYFPTESNQYGYLIKHSSILDKLDFSTSTNVSTNNGLGPINPSISFYSSAIAGGSKITRGTPNFENWNESATYGYVMLGTVGPTGADSSSVFRIDHTNETTSLPTAKQSITARAKNSRMQDNQYGFNFGGQGSPPSTYFSQFDRLDFLSETLSRLTNIPVADNSIASIDNDDIGYFIGGSSSTSPVPSSNYHRFDFKTDNVSYSKPSAVFNYIGSRGSLTFEDPSLRYGYVQGSYRPGTPQSLVARMEFSTETEVLSTPLLDKLAYGATAASKYHGYVMSGLNSPSSNTTYTRKFEWATETYGTIADTITEKRRLHSASHTGDSAWVMGGYKDNSPAGYTCTIERIDFETDTYSSPGNNFSVYLSQGSSHRGGSSLRQVGRNNRNDSRAGLDNQGRQVSSAMGYIVGGYVSLARSYVERLDMLNETISDPGTRLTHGKYLCKGINSRNYGYYMNAGSPNSAPEGGPGSNTSVVDKLDFSNETQDSFLSGVFGPNSASGAWTYDTNYGYGSVGQDTTLTPNYDTKLYRMDFETDGFSARQSTWVTGTNGKTRTATIQNNNFTTGYFIGEQPAQSNCEKLDFLTETLTQIQDYPEIVNMGAGTVRAPDAAYIAGGGAPNRTSNVYRLEYSTETFSAPGAQKAGGYDGSAGTFNENYGYFSKGYEPVGSYTSNTERMEFTNDTLLTVPSGKTSVLSSYGVGATQNAQ